MNNNHYYSYRQQQKQLSAMQVFNRLWRTSSPLPKSVKLMIAISLMSIASACTSLPAQPTQNLPEVIVVPPTSPIVDGSIYKTTNNHFLFEDVRARRVGDVINVVLEERTDATKEASTSTNKASGANIPGLTLFGGKVSALGREIFSTEVDSAVDFTGQADSTQSNRLSGSIAATVHQKLPNGNLWIKGQKILTLNQGSEVVKVSGQIRPTDIAPDNSVRSSQIADAQITYGGTGILANANNAGWLTRVFHNPLWPF